MTSFKPKKQIDDPASMPSGANSGYKGSGATGTGGLGGSRVVSSRGVAGKASGAKSGMTSTGKAKANAAESKTYNQPAKGSGKPKYQNTVKEARVNTKKLSTDRIAGKKLTESEAKARARKTPNLPKQIDREYKEQKGVRTAKPETSKVPAKKKGK